jgi:hypothetical protein
LPALFRLARKACSTGLWGGMSSVQESRPRGLTYYLIVVKKAAASETRGTHLCTQKNPRHHKACIECPLLICYTWKCGVAIARSTHPDNPRCFRLIAHCPLQYLAS